MCFLVCATMSLILKLKLKFNLKLEKIDFFSIYKHENITSVT